MCKACYKCAALLKVDHVLDPQSTTKLHPEVGVVFAADVIR